MEIYLITFSLNCTRSFTTEKSRHMYIGENVLHVIFRLQYMLIHVVSKGSSHTLSSVVHTALNTKNQMVA